MNKKVRILSIVLVLMLIANPVRLWTQTTVLAAEQTFAIDDKAFYDNIKNCLTRTSNNIGALLDSDDDNQTIKLDMEKVGEIKIRRCRHDWR